MKSLRKKDAEILALLAQGQSELQVGRAMGLFPAELEEVLHRVREHVAAEDVVSSTALLLERALRHRAEKAARSIEGRFNALLDASPEAVLVINGTTGIIRQVNQRAADLFGFVAEELMGRSMEDLVPPKVRGIHPAYRIGFVNSVRRREMGYHPPIFAVRKDGSEIEMAIALTASLADEDVMVVCTEFHRWNAEPASAIGSESA